MKLKTNILTLFLLLGVIVQSQTITSVKPAKLQNGQLVGRILAHDDDPDDYLTYTIIKGNPKGPGFCFCKYDPSGSANQYNKPDTTGLLYIYNADSFYDRKGKLIKEQYILSIKVTDSHGASSKAKVTINIKPSMSTNVRRTLGDILTDNPIINLFKSK